MNTFQTKPTNDNRMMKQLFQHVFQIQFQLDKSIDCACVNPEELKAVSERMSELLELLMALDES
ncbi:MAG: hypothetical protein HWE22_16170 [Flavobacteriales bacterium]|nr:hypothetical protein [Flavobacteriales bacterium]PIE87114.1 MAG: hypothetical protein CSA03_02580 [Bacteroidota bacterium]